MSQFVTSRGLNQYRSSEVHQFVAARTYRPNASRRGIVFCHGVAGDWSSWAQAAVVGKVRALAAAGYPVICCDLSAASYSGSNWGNTDHISAIAAAWTYAKSTFGFKTDKVGLLATSMGVAGALAWARANLSECFAVAGMVPVLDVNDVYQGDNGGHRASIGTAYGVTYPTSLGDLSTHSPVAFSAAALASLPVRLWAATDDAIASTALDCAGWGALGAAGASLTITSLGAVGHSATTVDAQQVVQFFDDCGGRA